MQYCLDIEIQVVPFASDENGYNTFDRLNFDVIILYKKKPKNILPSKLLFELTEFEKTGGIVIGILPFGFSQKADYEFDLLLQSYFGISKEERIRTVLLDDSDRKLNVSDREMLQYFEKEYRLASKYGLSSLNKSWSLVPLNDTARLIGISEDGNLAFIKNKNRLLYTGIFNSDSFNSFDESYSFFIDVLNFAKEVTTNKDSVSRIENRDYTNKKTSISPTASFTETTNDIPLFVSSTVCNEQEIWLTALQGFYVTTINKPDKYTFIPYPEELIKLIGPAVFKSQIVTPNKSRFRFYNNKIVFNGNNSIYMFDPYKPENGIDTLNKTMHETYILPIFQYGEILDFEIFGDLLFVLNKCSKISVINLEKKEIEYCIDLKGFRAMDIYISNKQVFALTKSMDITLLDHIIIGGGMTFTFVKALGGKIGNSLVEDDKQELALSILEKAKAKNVAIHLPVDAIIADDFSNDANTKEVDTDQIPDGWMGLDSGSKTAEKFAEVIAASKTILWNGPLGVFEMENFANGTISLGNAIAEATKNGAFSLVGGGDSVAAVKQFGFADKVSYVSTGGGAMLEMLEGKSLPGIEAIMK